MCTLSIFLQHLQMLADLILFFLKISENYLLGITKASIRSLDKALGVQPPKLHSQPDSVPSPCKHNTDIEKKVNSYVSSIWHPYLLEAIHIL